jgi:mono/diheme cytochrome c family protein
MEHPKTIVQTESYAGIDFNEALNAHMRWKQKLLDMLQSPAQAGLDPTEVARDDCCTLGLWLAGDGKSQYGRGAQFTELVLAHRGFHNSAAQVVHKIQSQDLMAASQELAGNFERLSAKVNSLLSNSIHGRETVEPHEDVRPIPWWLAVVIAALVVWSAWYFVTEGGSDRADTGDQRTPQALLEAPKSVNGQQIYSANCAACHQPTGIGVTGAFPPLANSDWVKGNPQRLARVLTYGLQGPAKVNGIEYNGAMPAFEAVLNDEQIAAVVTYIRGEWGNLSPPLEISLVKAARAEKRSKPWTEAELQ